MKNGKRYNNLKFEKVNLDQLLLREKSKRNVEIIKKIKIRKQNERHKIKSYLRITVFGIYST